MRRKKRRIPLLEIEIGIDKVQKTQQKRRVLHTEIASMIDPFWAITMNRKTSHDDRRVVPFFSKRRYIKNISAT